MSDRLCIVTGAGSGIGREVVRNLLSADWDVLALDLDEAALESAASDAPDGDRLKVATCDVTDPDSVGRAFQTLSDPHRLRGLVNSAGIAASVPFLDTPPELFRRVVETNLVGTFIVSQAAAKIMVATGGGAIVNISSVSGTRGNVGRAAYGSSKGGVLTLTAVMAVELASLGIRVNCVAPGPVATPLVEAMYTPEMRSTTVKAIPQKRFGKPAEVASSIAFLLDDEQSPFTTGATLFVDGGFNAGGLVASD